MFVTPETLVARMRIEVPQYVDDGWNKMEWTDLVTGRNCLYVLTHLTNTDTALWADVAACPFASSSGNIKDMR